MKLLNEDGKEINLKDRVKDFRGELCEVTGMEYPRHAGSTGRVYLARVSSNGKTQFPGSAYYPSVIRAKWSE